MNAAQRNKNDEFYTRYEDIEKEVSCYRQYLKGKKIYCNCDDPRYSNFYNFFKEHFYEYELDSLTVTYYSIDRPPYKTVYDGHWIVQTELSGDGSFDSPECLAILAESDIVITNPPFSKFVGFFDTLINSGKDFLIICTINTYINKDVFPHIAHNEIRSGYHAIGMFDTPEGSRKMGNIYWLTTLPVTGRKNIPLTKIYNPEEYPFYDGYNFINVDKTRDIPKDYKGIMGVPVSFLPKHNPEQFKIIGEMNHGSDSIYDLGIPYINGMQKFKRILIQSKD